MRWAGLAEPSGFVRVVEVDQQRVLTVAPVPESAYRAADPNPRGGRRGAKGVSFWKDRLVVANVERLFVLGRDWRLVRQITHPWLGGVHDVLCEHDGIWVACTDAELLVKLTWNGAVDTWWSWRDDLELAHALGFPSPLPPFDPALDYRDPVTTHGGTWNVVHLNSVARSNSELIVCFGRIVPSRIVRRRQLKGAVVRTADRIGFARRAVSAAARRRARRIDRGEMPVEPVRGVSSALVALGAPQAAPSRIVCRLPAVAGVPNHNVIVDRGALIYNDSNAGFSVRRESSGAEIRVPIPGSPAFPRGLAQLPDGRFVVGSQRPAALHVVDFDARTVTRSFPLGGVENESVYAIALVPDEFDDVPRLRFAA